MRVGFFDTSIKRMVSVIEADNPHAEWVDRNTPVGAVAFEIGDSDYYLGPNDEPLPVPPKPDTDYIFDTILGEWVRDLAYTAKLVNNKRAKLLQQSDWTQLPDVPLATKEVWATYRQALRDITDQPGYPTEVVWPVAPG